MFRTQSLSPAEIEAVVRGEHGDPFAVLGPHPVTGDTGPALAVRAFLPGARAVRVLPTAAAGAPQPMRRLHPEGFFEGVVPGAGLPFAYRLEGEDGGGRP